MAGFTKHFICNISSSSRNGGMRRNQILGSQWDLLPLLSLFRELPKHLKKLLWFSKADWHLLANPSHSGRVLNKIQHAWETLHGISRIPVFYQSKVCICTAYFICTHLYVYTHVHAYNLFTCLYACQAFRKSLDTLSSPHTARYAVPWVFLQHKHKTVPDRQYPVSHDTYIPASNFQTSSILPS